MQALMLKQKGINPGDHDKRVSLKLYHRPYIND